MFTFLHWDSFQVSSGYGRITVKTDHHICLKYNFWKKTFFSLTLEKNFTWRPPLKRREVWCSSFSNTFLLMKREWKAVSPQSVLATPSWSGSSHQLRACLICLLSHPQIFYWIRFSSLLWLPWKCLQVWIMTPYLFVVLWGDVRHPPKQFIIRYKRVCWFMFRFGKFWASCIYKKSFQIIILV